jgi:ABC transport system ATP-binding/permease protein
MSEKLLKAIIQLFAIVAKQDDLTQKERNNIYLFLNDHLNKEAADKYMLLFDELCLQQNNQEPVVVSAGGGTIDEDGGRGYNPDSDQTTKLSLELNKELTHAQKVILILDLVKLIFADGEISDQEMELVNLIGKNLNVDSKEIVSIKEFVVSFSPEQFASEDLLIIHADDIKGYHCKELTWEGLDGMLAILKINSVDSYCIKYLGKNLLSLNSTPLKAGSLHILTPGSIIKGNKIQPIFYSDIVSKYLDHGGDEKVAFVAEGITYKFKGGKIGLRDISVIEESGRLIGLMGASGSGKSTLLNVLNGNEVPYEGKVLINGIDIHKDKKSIEGVIGYVPQDDLLMDDLTVYQNLYYAAKLCFSNSTEEEIHALVIKTINNLGLIETKDLKVGSPLEKTISGGQRKRLNIGLELLREPSVLFVDEPTSGLSSRDSENIMDLLKELTLKGKLVFVVIHQPSSDIFRMFDRLVILDVGGYQIYYGNPVEAVIYFRDAINLISKDQGSCIECGNVNPEQIFNIIETKIVNEYGRFTNERKTSPQQWNDLFKQSWKAPLLVDKTEAPNVTQKIPNKLKQLGIFATRDLLSKVSNKQYMLINFLEAPLLAFILAYIVRYYPTDANVEQVYLFSKNINIPAYFFMSIIVALFMGLTVSAEEIFKDRKILKREKFLNLSRSSYLLSKVLILFSFSLVQTICFVLIGDNILEIEGMNLTYWLILFSVSCFANLLGLNISSAFNSAITIYILIPILLIPQLILSGVVVNFDKLNPHISSHDKVPVVGELMASRWAFEAIMVSQFKNNKFESNFYELDKEMANTDYKKIYYLPTLESKLDAAFVYFSRKEGIDKEQYGLSLDLLRNELASEIKVLGNMKYSDLDNLSPDRFNHEVYKSTMVFLKDLKNHYIDRFNFANNAKENLINNMTDTQKEIEEYDLMKKHFQNESIGDLVKNLKESHRIVEADGRLIRKINPIYMDPDHPEHFFDFRTQFFVAKKHFMGNYIETTWFNVMMIWAMTIFLGGLLHFDVLRRIVESLSNFSWKKNL